MNRIDFAALRRKFFVAFVAMCALVLAGACSDEGESVGSLPQPIAKFVSEYFPGMAVNSFTTGADGYHVRLSDGPGLTFDANYNWEVVDGYGMPLPQMLLFDQLPPKVYEYLQGTEALNGVFSVARTSTYYTVTLLDSTLRYTIRTGELTTV